MDPFQTQTNVEGRKKEKEYCVREVRAGKHVLEFPVICATASRVNQTARNSGDQKSIFNFELNDMVELLLSGCQHFIQFFRLWDRTRETVEDKTVQ